jgi:hypothetical protein
MTGMPPPRHASVPGTPSGRGATLVPAIQADGYLGAAKPGRPDGIGLVCAAAANERSSLR